MPDRRRGQVGAGSAAAGRTLRDLSREQGVWVSLLVRGGKPVGINADTVLAEGDEVLVPVDPEQPGGPADVFAAAG